MTQPIPGFLASAVASMAHPRTIALGFAGRGEGD